MSDYLREAEQHFDTIQELKREREALFEAIRELEKWARHAHMLAGPVLKLARLLPENCRKVAKNLP